MRYALYDLGSKLLQPTHKVAAHLHTYFQKRSHLQPRSKYYRVMDAVNALVERDTRQFNRPCFKIDAIQVDGKNVQVTEHEIREHPFCTLRHFQKNTRTPGSKVLIVAPMAGHYATLLKDTVKRLLVTHDVYITDWKNARDVPVCEGRFDLDDYIDLLLTFFQAMEGPFHVVAVCQPTVPVTIATILCEQTKAPHTPQTVTLMGGPIDTRVNPSMINHFAKSHSLVWFDAHCITAVPAPHAGALRRVCPGYRMLAGFMALDPTRHTESTLKFFESLIKGDEEAIRAHTQFYDEYRSVMDLSAEYVMQTLDHVFQQHLLPRGQFEWRGRLAKPEDWCKTPVLTIEGELDNISPPGQTHAIHDLLPHLPAHKQAHHLQKGTGHYGIFSGHKWRDQIAPVIEGFMSRHD